MPSDVEILQALGAAHDAMMVAVRAMRDASNTLLRYPAASIDESGKRLRPAWNVPLAPRLGLQASRPADAIYASADELEKAAEALATTLLAIERAKG